MIKTQAPLMSKGYTLIEILVVLAITGILFTVGYANFRDYARRQTLIAAVRALQTDLRSAQESAVAGNKPAGCLGNLTGYKFKVNSNVVYEIDASCTGGDVLVKQVNLPVGMTIDTPSVNPILFNALATGTNIPNGTTIVLITRQISTNGFRSIEISSTGSIKESLASAGSTAPPTAQPTPTPGPIVLPPGSTPLPTSPGYSPVPGYGWTKCADENGVCDFGYQGISVAVEFAGPHGAIYKVFPKEVHNTDCNSSVFGGDPSPGSTDKFCAYQFPYQLCTMDRLPNPAAQQTIKNDYGIILYPDANFGGENKFSDPSGVTFYNSTPDLPDSLRYKVSSIFILYPQGPVNVRLCTGYNYTGICETFPGSDLDFRDNLIGDDTARSLQLIPYCHFNGFGEVTYLINNAFYGTKTFYGGVACSGEKFGWYHGAGGSCYFRPL